MKRFFAVAATLMTLLGGFTAQAEDFTIESGDYKIVIGDRPEKWSIARIFYQGKEIGTRTGFYSSVLAPQNGKYIGAGHTEGGSEKVLSSSLEIDGKIVDIGSAAGFKGDKVLFTKTGLLANVELRSTLILTPQGIVEEREFKALEDQPVYSFYIYQYCLNKCSTDYLFFRADGTKKEGSFAGDEKMRVYGESNAYCFTQFFPEFQLGVMNYTANFGPAKGKNLLWDRKVYHKYYFWPDLPPVLKKGYVSPKWTMIVRAFPAADRTAWLAEAEKLNEQLRRDFPFAPKPARQEPLNGSVFALKGAPNFQVQKIALQLEPGADYSISFAICKEGEFSPKPSDHYTLVGGYDAQKKFHGLANLGDNVKPDGQWHTCRKAFTAPEYETFLYIYNSRSTGTLSLKDLVVEKQ